MKTTKEIGDIGEKFARKLLKKKKFKIRGTNLHFGKNELDIVAESKEILVFAEVKTRSVSDVSKISFEISAAAAVDKDKIARTITAARLYLSENPTQKQIRFDVIEVYLDKNDAGKILNVNHIENAFL